MAERLRRDTITATAQQLNGIQQHISVVIRGSVRFFLLSFTYISGIDKKMTDERVEKQMESGGNVSGDERRAEIANIENEVAALIQQG
ncbi:Uncharacterized protein BM_BM8497 [Brugia malayi]|uniref:Bm8497 n=1 Tax=Brugia malayi TaxID=6279 RepID=A0A0J9YCR8_BRUMA|nr:Uncharacterized protein BM_BM8497 [Brugia malayi]CDQ06738.1 Bm8497 [Brugia malayi]VIO94882.1 Uncharacterized protein BM_BM8497 [Brugia malayi]